mgnify:CR=1 FL=1
MKQYVTLDAVSSRLEFSCHVEWHENRKFLKVEFPLAVHCDFATYSSQFGHVRRPTHRNTSVSLPGIPQERNFNMFDQSNHFNYKSIQPL